MRSSAALIAGLLAFASGCGGPCTRNSDCAGGLVCGPLTVCVPPPDMSSLDGGIDLASFDGAGQGQVDAGDAAMTLPDGSLPDGGVPDAGVPDLGAPDGSVPDGSADAGLGDAGALDGGGDLSRLDGAPLDGAPTD